MMKSKISTKQIQVKIPNTDIILTSDVYIEDKDLEDFENSSKNSENYFSN